MKLETSLRTLDQERDGLQRELDDKTMLATSLKHSLDEVTGKLEGSDRRANDILAQAQALHAGLQTKDTEVRGLQENMRSCQQEMERCGPFSMSLLTGSFVMEYPYLAESFVLEYPYRLNLLYWSIPTDRIFCTGVSLLTESFVLEYPY